MSEKSKINRAKKEMREEKKAKSVINWIFIGLIVFAIIFMAVYVTSFM